MAAELTYPDAAGYDVGPTLLPGVAPWPCGWERAPLTDDGHEHHWESVLVRAPGRGGPIDEVIRCAICHAPRCDGRGMVNPCMDRRHHRGDHRHLSGQRAPLGASLSRLAP